MRTTIPTLSAQQRFDSVQVQIEARVTYKAVRNPIVNSTGSSQSSVPRSSEELSGPGDLTPVIPASATPRRLSVERKCSVERSAVGATPLAPGTARELAESAS